MHADHIPFLVLCGLTAGAGLFLYSTSKKLAITFIIAGFLPTVGAFSNSEDWPVPFSVELAMIIAGVAVLFALSFVVATSKRLRRSLPGQFSAEKGPSPTAEKGPSPRREALHPVLDPSILRACACVA
jgi:hypothetical protein